MAVCAPADSIYIEPWSWKQLLLMDWLMDRQTDLRTDCYVCAGAGLPPVRHIPFGFPACSALPISAATPLPHCPHPHPLLLLFLCCQPRSHPFLLHAGWAQRLPRVGRLLSLRHLRSWCRWLYAEKHGGRHSFTGAFLDSFALIFSQPPATGFIFQRWQHEGWRGHVCWNVVVIRCTPPAASAGAGVWSGRGRGQVWPQQQLLQWQVLHPGWHGQQACGRGVEPLLPQLPRPLQRCRRHEQRIGRQQLAGHLRRLLLWWVSLTQWELLSLWWPAVGRGISLQYYKQTNKQTNWHSDSVWRCQSIPVHVLRFWLHL